MGKPMELSEVVLRLLVVGAFLLICIGFLTRASLSYRAGLLVFGISLVVLNAHHYGVEGAAAVVLLIAALVPATVTAVASIRSKRFVFFPPLLAFSALWKLVSNKHET